MQKLQVDTLETCLAFERDMSLTEEMNIDVKAMSVMSVKINISLAQHVLPS